jgi:quercetin dioxygenase-like cupin family protein
MNAPPDDDADVLAGLAQSLGQGMAQGLRPARLDDAQHRRLRDRVRAIPSETLPVGLSTLRRSDGEWLPLNPLVHIKVLRVDAAAGIQTVLLRAARGALLPGHRHSRDEEFIVLEGECHIGGLRLEAGDAHFAAAGSWHDDITTDTGVLVLVRGEYPAPVYA